MSGSIFETFTDERGNISVRISQEVQVLTREEANRIEAEYRRMQAENAKLREQIHWLKQGDILHVLTDQEYIDQCERERLMQVSIDALDKENAKLRELVRDMMRYYFMPSAIDSKQRETELLERAHELGVEKDNGELGVEVD